VHGVEQSGALLDTAAMRALPAQNLGLEAPEATSGPGEAPASPPGE
jgi:hypothetical protein